MPDADDSLVRVAREGRSVSCSLNRPKQLNALSGELMTALVGGARGARCGRRHPRDRARRQRARLRRRRRHRRARRRHTDLAVRGRRLDRWDRIRDLRTPTRRGGVRLLPRRRVRARDALRPDRRVGVGEVRPARDQSRRAAGRRRNATAHARRRQGGGDGHDPHRPDALGPRGARFRPRRTRRRERGLARRGEACRARDRRERAGRGSAREGGGRPGVRVAARRRRRVRAPYVPRSPVHPRTPTKACTHSSRSVHPTSRAVRVSRMAEVEVTRDGAGPDDHAEPPRGVQRVQPRAARGRCATRSRRRAIRRCAPSSSPAPAGASAPART